MPKTKTPAKPKPFLPLWTMLLLLIVWLVSGCETQPKTLPPSPVQGVQIPPLPMAARQAQTPSTCLPSCLEAWTKQRQDMQQRLTQAASVDLPASVLMKPPAKP